MSTSPTVPVLHPNDGTWWNVPVQYLSKVKADGGIVGINMIGPDGTLKPVRADRMHMALADGLKIAPQDGGGPPPPGGLWSDVKKYAGDLANVPAGLMNMGQMVGEGLSGAPGPAITGAVTNAIQQDANSKAAGYGIPYRVGAGIAGIAGTNVPGMEQSAAQGDVGGVLGHAAAGATLAAAPLVAEGVMRGANDIVPSTMRAGEGIATLRTQLDPVPVTGKLPSYQLASDLLDKWDRTKTPVPPQLRAYVENAAGANAGTPLTFQDLWEHREALNDLKFDRNVPGKQAKQIGQVAKLQTDELQGIANKNQLGPDWKAQQAEYAKGKAIVRGAEGVGPYVGALAGYEAGRLVGAPLGAEFGAGALGRYAGKPIIGGLARSIIERDAGPPQLSGASAPAPVAEPPALPVVPAKWKPPSPEVAAQYAAANEANLRKIDSTYKSGPPRPFDTTEDASGTADRALQEQFPELRRRSSDAAGAAPRPPAIWSPSERTINTAPAGQAIEASGPAGEVEHTIAPEPTWPSEYANAPRALGGNGAGANYSAADLARLKARNGIKETP